MNWDQPGYLIALSDGIIEAENDCGAALGMEAVSDAVRVAAGEHPFPHILKRLNQHLAGAVPHDDTSLAVIRLS
jgi:serine phosphatase RsbU (regulator of sigma subunit)